MTRPAQHGWSNWAHTESATAARVVAPRSADEVAMAVKQAGKEGLRVKAVGSGHSFTGVAVTDGVRLELFGLDELHSVDPASGLVKVGSGITLARLNHLLWQHGLAMTNLGDIDSQTISGAVSTGTHGTGAAFGGLATQVRALDLALADGTVVTCSDTQRPDLFDAARIGLGALGVITAVTLQCVPAFALHAVERPARLAQVLERFDALADGTDHFEIPYWFPHTDRLVTKVNNRRPPSDGIAPLPKTRRWVDDELLANRVYEFACRIGTGVPQAVRPINQVAARLLTAREFTDRSYRVFVSRREVRFREMEYAVPRGALADVLRELHEWFRRTDERVMFPLEIRVAAADDVWLSTAYQRDSAYVAVHRYHRLPYGPYFAAVEPILRAAGGRPHLGKLHTLGAEDLRLLYPRFDDFREVRDSVDPERLFTNPHLDHILGP